LEELKQRQADGTATIWEPQIQPAILGNTLSPMISNRSSFEKLMTQTHSHHQHYLKKFHPKSSKTYLPLQFPVLTAEIKLDGERMIVHIKTRPGYHEYKKQQMVQ
jgi:ATP-dependent DNA ligase